MVFWKKLALWLGLLGPLFSPGVASAQPVPPPAHGSICGAVSTPPRVSRRPGWETPAWTWACWIRSGAPAYTTGIFSTSNLGNGTTEGVCLESYGDTLYLDVNLNQLAIIQHSDNRWHHYAFAFADGTIKVFVDGKPSQARGGVGPMRWGKGDLSLAGFGDPGIRMSDPRIYTVALADADIATLAGLAEPATPPAYRWPCADGKGKTVTEVVAGADAVASSGITWAVDTPWTPSEVRLTPSIASAQVSPSGELIYVVPKLPNEGGTFGTIREPKANGASATIDGTKYDLGPPISSFFLEGWFYPVLPPPSNWSVDDHDASCTSTGTWTEVVAGETPGHLFTGSDAANAQFRQSSDPAATWTWHISAGSLTPGRYRLWGHLWGLPGPDRTADAVYTVRDGAGNVLGTPAHRDLTKALHPDFDMVRYRMAVHDLGYFDVGPGQAGLTVTLSNGAGAGVLPADDIVIESAFVSPAKPGSVITVDIPAGAANVAGKPTDAVSGLEATFATEEEWTYPIKAPAERTLKVGYNTFVNGLGWYKFPVYLADRSLSCQPWQGCDVDEHFEMKANPNGTASRIVAFYPSGDRGLTPWGAYLYDDGVQRFEFDASGVTFDDAARGGVVLEMYNGGGGPAYSQPVFGERKWTDLGKGRWRLEQFVGRPKWEPIATRTFKFDPSWTQGFAFRVKTPGLVTSNWKWFDSRTPIGYEGTAHPDEVKRYKGAIHSFRSMNALGTVLTRAANPGDYTTPDDRTTPDNVGFEKFRTSQAEVVAVHPVDFDPATDPHHWHRYFTVDPTLYYAYYVLELDRDPATVGFPPGVQLGWSRGFTLPRTVGGDVDLGGGSCAFPIGGNQLLVAVVTGSYSTAEKGPATLTETKAIEDTSVFIMKTNTIPFETFLDYCKDNDASPWINFSHLATDDMIRWMAKATIARTRPDQEINGELSNETWNAFFISFAYYTFMANHGNWLNKQDPKANPLTYPTPTSWYAHDAIHKRDVFREEMVAAGRDPNLFIMNYGGITQALGPSSFVAEQMKQERDKLGAKFGPSDRLTLEYYQDSVPPGGQHEGPDLPASFSRIGVDGKIDLLAAATFTKGSRRSWMASHRRVLDDAGLNDVGISAYEGGLSYVDPSNNPQTIIEMMSSPRIYRLNAAYLSFMQDCGFSLVMRFSDKDPTVPGSELWWTDFAAPFSPGGTGSPGENRNPYHYPSVVSELFGATRDFATGVKFASAGGTTGPDKPTGPTDPDTTQQKGMVVVSFDHPGTNVTDYVVTIKDAAGTPVPGLVRVSTGGKKSLAVKVPAGTYTATVEAVNAAPDASHPVYSDPAVSGPFTVSDAGNPKPVTPGNVQLRLAA